MLIPVLGPRRPSFLFRYVAPACILLLLAYSFSLPSKLHMVATAAQKQGKQRPQYHISPKVHQIPVPPTTPDDDRKHKDGAPSPDAELAAAPTARPAAEPSAQPPPPPAESTQHPIEHLIGKAETAFQDMLGKETHGLAQAAEAYRKRRGRHPPPWFDKWYRFATERGAVVIEDFWDQIYHDLHPFWALPAKQIQREAGEFEMKISVRGGHASTKSGWFWTQIWLDMLQTIEAELPDMDIAVNAMDEPRVVVPWETMKNYVAEADRTMGVGQAKKPDEVRNAFQQLPPLRADDIEDFRAWETAPPFWDVVRRGCAPQSAARQAATQTDFSGRASHISSEAAYSHMYRGFVANSTLSSDICHQPDLQGLNGIFIEPLSIASTPVLFPMFGGSKLSVNSDILLPAAMYWSNEERFSTGSRDGRGAHGQDGGAWADKTNGAVWRGVATGGRNTASNWHGFHRHRFVAMNDGKLLSRAEAALDSPPNFELPAASTYKLRAQADGRLGPWVDQWSDCGFVDLMCSAEEEVVEGQSEDTAESRKQVTHKVMKTTDNCDYVEPFFPLANSVPLPEQLHHKYLPDIDGNSFSGRYLAFLRSTSLPIKATLWKEWHDARLVAWKHYVPMDNRFGDWFGIMEYFLGYGSATESHDAAAEKIAAEGKAWADRVMRKEDMQVYVLRLLLEYARVFDEKRELLGWVGDLMEKKSGEKP